jgi:acetyl-CoA carboxylase biotin carboxyl carrier protein
MEINQEVIAALLDAFERSDWREMTVTIGADRLHVSRDPVAGGNASAPGPQPAPAHTAPAPAAAAIMAPGVPPSAPEEPLHSEAHEAPHAKHVPVPTGTVVESPSVGLFWRAPSPAAPPFVEVGGPVSAGDTVAIVEVMKLMNHVVAPVAGTVKAILPANGEAVEYGQPLIVIDPEG